MNYDYLQERTRRYGLLLNHILFIVKQKNPLDCWRVVLFAEIVPLLRSEDRLAGGWRQLSKGGGVGVVKIFPPPIWIRGKICPLSLGSRIIGKSYLGPDRDSAGPRNTNKYIYYCNIMK